MDAIRIPRPPAFDASWYTKRNTVERCFSKLKQFRAVATRYDKRERIYQGTIDVASISIWLRGAVAIDSTDLLIDCEAGPELSKIITRAAGRPLALVLAGDPDTLASGFGGWLADARRARRGCLTAPQTLPEGDLIGVRLPRDCTGRPPRPRPAQRRRRHPSHPLRPGRTRDGSRYPMMLDMDICPGAAQRAEAARHLIARARDGELVDLAVISAMDLCVLGGAEPPLLDEAVSRAWNRLGGRQRDKITEAATESLLGRGLLTDEGLRTSARPRSGRYAPRPELGLVLAARRRPSFVIRTEVEGQDLRGLRLFALGDQAEPTCGLVAEVPAGLPPGQAGESSTMSKLGPLGWARFDGGRGCGGPVAVP